MKYEMAMSFLIVSFFFMIVVLLQYVKPGPRRRNNMIFLSILVFTNILMWEIYDEKDEIIYTPETIQSLLDIGLDKKDIMVLMFGYGYIEADKIKCDNEFRGYLNGLIGIGSDYKTRIIDKFFKDSKMGYFEMGLKYPSFDWQKVVDLYNINLTPKIITTENDYRKSNYEVWTGDGVAIGHQISYQNKGAELQESGEEIGVVNLKKPTKYQIEREYPAGFNGGYWGIVVKEKDDLYRIIEMLVVQKSGYLKDLEVFTNGLGGIGSEDVFGEFAKGGETKNKWEYTDKDEIEYVIVKDKYGEELKFDGKDVISGVHDLLEKGGKLTEIGKYYSKNDVVSVFVNGKNILDKNTVSGVWIKKDAIPNKDKFNKDEFNEGIVSDLYDKINGKKIKTQNQRSIKEAIESANENSKYYKGYSEVYIGANYVGSSKNGVFTYSSKYKGTKYDEGGMMADGGDVSEMKIGKTTIRKGYNGWVGKTMVDNFKGYDWDITTIKNSRGDLTTTAQGGKSEDKGGYKMFSFMLFQDPSIRLQTSRPARVNEKAVSEQHAEALKVFEEKVGEIQDKQKMADGGMMAKGGKLKVNGEDFSFLLELSDKELSKKLDLVRKEKNINAKQYFTAREKGESTTKIEESGSNLDNQERAIIEARIRVNKMADGGAIGFDALAKKVAKNYEGDKVKKEFQDEYGKTYDKQEAEEVGKKVAGKVYRQQQAKGKMAKGGKVDKKTGTNLNRSQSKMTLISRKASEIRKANEPWRDAFNRAKAMLYS